MKRAFAFIRRHGAKLFCRCIACKIYYFILQQVYGFDSWHASAPYACRPYKAIAANLASSLRPAVVVDIGCGLGEVLAHVKADKRFGLDLSAQTLRVARLLYGHNIHFITASVFAPDQVSRAVNVRPVDLLMMMNWPDGVATDVLIEALSAILREMPARYLLIDTLRPGMDDGHAHPLAALARLGNIIRTVDGGDGVRDLHLIRLAAPG